MTEKLRTMMVVLTQPANLSIFALCAHHSSTLIQSERGLRRENIFSSSILASCGDVPCTFSPTLVDVLSIGRGVNIVCCHI